MKLNIPSAMCPQHWLARLLVSAAVLGLTQSGALSAQVPEIERLPIGAIVEIDTKRGDLKGTVVGLDEDSISLQANGDPNNERVTVSRLSVESMRVKDSGPLWTHPLDAQPWDFAIMDASRGSGAPSDPLAILAFDDRIVALDASTGAVRWEVEKLAGLSSTPYPGLGLLTEDYAVNGIDLSNGKVLWRRQEPSDSLHAMVHWPSDSLIIQFRIGDEDRVRMLALDAMTGQQAWETTDFVTQDLAKDGSLQFVGLDDSDRAVIYVSRDGPFLVDISNGEVLWRGLPLTGRPVPSRRSGSATVTADDSLVYVPTERGVAAFDRANGERRWELWDDESLRPRLLAKTPWGLLVFASRIADGSIKETQFYLLDRATGQPVWKVEDAGAGHVFTRPDSVFVGGTGKVAALDIEHGALGEVAKFKVWRGAALRHFGMDQDGYHFGWAFGASALNRSGEERFEVYFEPPGQSFSEAALSGNRSRPGGMGGSEGWYVYTGEPIEDKTFGFSIARIDMETGEVAGRVYLDDRNPNYRVNRAADLAFVQRENEIAAYAFGGCRAVEHAAGRGDAYLINLLAAKGVGPTSPAGRDCHPLPAAARYGRDSAVSQLVRAGWMAEPSEDGWSPIHYAAAHGHLGVVQILLEAGSQPDIATAGVFAWTPLLLAARWGHVEVAAELEAAGATATQAKRKLVESMWLAEAGDLEAAVQARREAELLSPDQAPPPHYRSLFCYRAALVGRAEEALDDCDAGVESDPEDSYAYLVRAYARGLAEDFGGSTSDLRTLFRLDPFDENARAYLNMAYEYEAGRQPLTEKHLDELRQKTPAPGRALTE